MTTEVTPLERLKRTLQSLDGIGNIGMAMSETAEAVYNQYRAENHTAIAESHYNWPYDWRWTPPYTEFWPYVRTAPGTVLYPVIIQDPAVVTEDGTTQSLSELEDGEYLVKGGKIYKRVI